MKYNSKNTPLVCMQTNSTCYKGTTVLPKIKGVLWHSTGANNPTLKRYVQPSRNDPDYNRLLRLLGKNAYNNDWNSITRYAGMNAWIGKLADGTVAAVQTMPWNFKPWGCGTGSKGSCNDGWIQFEICEDGLTDPNYFNQVYKEACELTAYLCAIYNLDPLGTATHKGVNVPVILCHQDSYKLGLGGNHADVLHWFPKHGKNMDTVRRDVAALMKTIAPTPSQKVEMYRVRTAWSDIASQKGAYSNLNNAINACKSAGTGYSVFDSEGKVVYSYTNVVPNGLQATELLNLSQEKVIEKVGPLFTKDQEKTGVLACVSFAQFLLESAYGQSELAQKANNCFGMKKMLSGNTWENSTWNGKVYSKQTQEFENGAYKTITAEFREYENIEDSIADHSAYLLGAKKGANLRYQNLKNEQDYKIAAQIIKDGGYATSPTYVSSLCNLIEKWDLDKYNAKVEPKEEPKKEVITSKFSVGEAIRLKPNSTYTNGKAIPTWVINSKLYVRDINGDNIVFSTLKSGAITGVTKESNLMNYDGPEVENEKDVNYLVKITANLLNVRSGPGVNYPITTTVKHNYNFHIKAESNGWGQLDSGAGWINLKYTERVEEKE